MILKEFDVLGMTVCIYLGGLENSEIEFMPRLALLPDNELCFEFLTAGISIREKDSE